MKLFFSIVLSTVILSTLVYVSSSDTPRAGNRNVAQVPTAMELDETSVRVAGTESPQYVDASIVVAKATTTSPRSIVSEENDQAIRSIETTPTLRGQVLAVVDGDTFKVQVGTRTETVRIIGIDTPETVHPTKPVECFGREASAYATTLLAGTLVTIVPDLAQGEYDVYGRRLGYITLADNRDFGAVMIGEGYAYEYTYGGAYAHQARYRQAEADARVESRGLWASGVCDSFPAPATESDEELPEVNDRACTIKGNISRGGEMIYHLPGQQNYTDTVITESAGEQYFCTEAEAISAGWRKALR